MTPHKIAALVNLLGFITGTALYAMLLAMVLRAVDRPLTPSSNPGHGQRTTLATERMLLATGLLGLLWNLGALVIYGARDWNMGQPSRWFEAAVFTALGFLPAVVVHSVLRAGEELARQTGARVITILAYALSAFAGVMHCYAVSIEGETPSGTALRTLTFGFSGLSVVLIIYARRSSIWKRALWVVALAVFAVSALHISQHTTGDEPWFIELIGHHASLPLVIAMLYQDYRFALADIFLKRTLAVVVLVALAFGLYVMVVTPLLRARDADGDPDPRAVGVLIGLWIGTALIYPLMRRAIVWFVDAVILHRANYQRLRDELALIAASCEEPGEILDQVCARLKEALTARELIWVPDEQETEEEWPDQGSARQFVLPSQVVRVTDQEGEARLEPRHPLVRLRRTAATVLIPTHEPPRYCLVIGELSGGRQLLSDDIALLESVALMLARRIDAARVTHERCERNLREHEISKLATEAELRALRAQLNPHFLFNALTTISYLIQTAPGRALETLMRLTGLLRAVLRAPQGSWVTIGEEMDLIESYLAIEHARFEERLRVVIDVPAELHQLRIPPLVVQPLVENAIKHGIAPRKDGGEVIVTGRLESGPENLPAPASGSSVLCLSIRDTGVGVSELALTEGRRRGVGLANVERRLECFYGPAASLNFSSAPGQGTLAEIRVPLSSQNEALLEYQFG
ncbi:MAG TPA: histidine kinase [Blastocatellia bacterium]|nr:histidine kinase [Blastocatellia bacterium]